MIEDRTLEDFVVESNRIEGIVREPDDPQLAREIEVTRAFVRLPHPGVIDLENFVSICTSAQAHPAILRRRPGLHVRMGDYFPPPGGPLIEEKLLEILKLAPMKGPFYTHHSYENLHPFTDGNGRSGRVLWLWQMGGVAPLGFLHRFYYQTLDASRR